MEEISVNGENYVKASVLAKNFGYTPDYIGQLCRSEQVKCTLVGRSWYVNEDSLREHRKGRYRSSSAKSKEHLRKVVEDQSVATTHTKSSVTAKYETDERELFPVLNKTEETKITSPEGDLVSNVAINKLLSIASVQNGVRTTASAIRRPAPVLRTIPALQPVKSPIRPKQTPAVSRKSEFTPSRVSTVGTFAIFLGILLVESMLLFGVLGLEKRLVLADSNQAMVLYGFDAEKVFDSIKSFQK
ncbi:hypothetical protein COU14_01060 [Candidatus Kaiserbacteria bacterium CG10_big_fil_rev_8_21_14_0_10_44_10]|uniref:Helix-turn-helix domain-containing protein n=1 Tax=Candidatus Kaiserbacteria bacterium CG10_big_fil_rev_8_21_14_0_10_44_10 TaxID=1974606 RepID=A0A2H0UI37_9BACT|nr:MAG: hypothetical protein COU14_01060 [Candidatus Kaiserbacteria bacterium CG10_big_fil_rev_8_21_14_0_10_44_10]